MRTARSSYEGTANPLRAERSASATEEPTSPYVRAVESMESAADVVAQQWRRCTRQRVGRRGESSRGVMVVLVLPACKQLNTSRSDAWEFS